MSPARDMSRSHARSLACCDGLAVRHGRHYRSPPWAGRGTLPQDPASVSKLRMRLFGTPSTRLERRRLVDRAWQLYVQDGVAPSDVSDDISDSWRRAREAYRIDPGIERPARVLSSDALAERCERDEALALASPILRDFAARLALSGHVLAYFDGDGWMLTIDGDRRVVELVEDINFRPGANWAEDAAGTNGPGTALAAGKPLEVFASEHFVAALQPWSCAAAPVMAPGLSTPVGLVDITGPWEVQRRQAILVAKAVARAVEERLRAAVTIRDEVVKYAFRAAHDSGDALVAIDARGQVVAANDAATRRRILEAGALPPSIRGALAGVLRAARPGHGGEIHHEPPNGGPAFIASPVEYEGTRVGAIVRIPAPSSAARSSRTRARPTTRYDLGRILGRSAPLQRVIDLARTAARNELAVILFGESGTGKELFAQAIHSASGRRGGPFVAVNCGSIPGPARRGGAVRIRVRDVHRRAARGERRQVRGRGRRDALPRRGERAAFPGADGAPARAPGEGGRPPRWQRASQGGRADRGRDEQAPRGGDRRRPIPPRSPLPAQRPLDRRTSPPRSRGRRRAPRSRLPRRGRDGGGPPRPHARRGRRDGAEGPPLAGERAGAAQRDPESGRDRAARGDLGGRSPARACPPGRAGRAGRRGRARSRRSRATERQVRSERPSAARCARPSSSPSARRSSPP